MLNLKLTLPNGTNTMLEQFNQTLWLYLPIPHIYEWHRMYITSYAQPPTQLSTHKNKEPETDCTMLATFNKEQQIIGNEPK